MTMPQPILDGGWAWTVVAGGFINNFLSMGFFRSGGIIYVSSTSTFQTSRSVASWIPMVTLTVVYLMAPVGTLLCKRFSYPKVTLAGGLLASLGMLICYLATRVEYMFVGWGVVFGFGSSMAFFPTIALVGQYFKQKRPIANGIVLTGGALGAFCLPPLLEYLVRTYGLHGTALITCAVTLHYCITSGLLLMLERRKQKFSKDPNEEKPTAEKEMDTKAVHCHFNEVSLDDEIGSSQNNGGELKTSSQSQNEPSLCKMATANGIANECPLHNTLIPSLNFINLSCPKSNPLIRRLQANNQTQLSMKRAHSLPKASQHPRFLPQNGLHHKNEQAEMSNDEQEFKKCSITTTTNIVDNHQLHLHLDPANNSSQGGAQSSISRHAKVVSALKSIVESLDLRVICNCTFIVNCCSNAIQTALFMALITILPDYGEDEIGVSRMQAAYFVSASAVADLLTRFLSGWILSRFEFDKEVVCFFVLLLNSIVFAIIALTKNYIIVMICSILAGTCFAFGMILYFEILASCQSADRYPMAFGLSEVMKSPLLLLAAASVGTLKDATGSYAVTLFIFCGLGSLATSLWIFHRFLAKKEA